MLNGEMKKVVFIKEFYGIRYVSTILNIPRLSHFKFNVNVEDVKIVKATHELLRATLYTYKIGLMLLIE